MAVATDAALARAGPLRCTVDRGFASGGCSHCRCSGSSSGTSVH